MKKCFLIASALLLTCIVSGKPFYGISVTPNPFSVASLSSAQSLYANFLSSSSFIKSPTLAITVLYPGYDIFFGLNSYGYNLSNYINVAIGAMGKCLGNMTILAADTTSNSTTLFGVLQNTFSQAIADINSVNNTANNAPFTINTLNNLTKAFVNDINSMSTQVAVIKTAMDQLAGKAKTLANLQTYLPAAVITGINTAFAAISASATANVASLTSLKNSLNTSYTILKMADTNMTNMANTFNASFVKIKNATVSATNTLPPMFTDFVNGISGSINDLIKSLPGQIKNSSTFNSTVSAMFPMVGSGLTNNTNFFYSNLVIAINNWTTITTASSNLYDTISTTVNSVRLSVFNDNINNPNNTNPCAFNLTFNATRAVSPLIQNISMCINNEATVLDRVKSLVGAILLVLKAEFSAFTNVTSRCGTIPMNNPVFNATTCYLQRLDKLNALQTAIPEIMNTVANQITFILNSSSSRLQACSLVTQNSVVSILGPLFANYEMCISAAAQARVA